MTVRFVYYLLTLYTSMTKKDHKHYRNIRFFLKDVDIYLLRKTMSQFRSIIFEKEEAGE